MLSIRYTFSLLTATGLMASSCAPARMHFTDATNAASGAFSAAAAGSGIIDSATLAKACAGRASQLKAQKFPLHFPKPANGCEWNKNGNLGLVDAQFQARTEQIQKVSLPPNSVICDMEFEFAKQPFYYDDEFFFTFNGIVMAGSFNMSKVFDSSDGLQTYDWSRIVGRPWTDGKAQAYCAGMELGLSTCSFPVTSTTGQIAVNYNPQLVLDVAARALKQTDHEFRWVTTGDNDDPVDCRHEPVDVDVNVTYLEL